MNHVLWIGGPPAAGKTTVAARLARRHGLRLYSADTMTWVHRDRAVAEGHVAAQRWEAMTPFERWELSTVDEMLAMSLHRERGAMVIDDVRSLPTAPIVVAEGSTVPATGVADGLIERSAVVWLLPTREFQDEQLVASGVTGGRAQLYRKLRDVIECDAQALDLPVLTVDGSQDIEEMDGLVEARFAARIVAGPRAAMLRERQVLLRESNLAIVRQVRGYYGRAWAEGDGESTIRVFACECGDRTCVADVSASVGHVATAPLSVPGHHRR